VLEIDTRHSVIYAMPTVASYNKSIQNLSSIKYLLKVHNLNQAIDKHKIHALRFIPLFYPAPMLSVLGTKLKYRVSAPTNRITQETIFI